MTATPETTFEATGPVGQDTDNAGFYDNGESNLQKGGEFLGQQIGVLGTCVGVAW